MYKIVYWDATSWGPQTTYELPYLFLDKNVAKQYRDYLKGDYMNAWEIRQVNTGEVVTEYTDEKAWEMRQKT